jgi:hypothetical protein
LEKLLIYMVSLFNQTTMKRTFILILTCLGLFGAAHSQNHHARASSSFSMSFLGNSPLIGLNYDQLILRKESINLGFRLGLPLANPITNYFFQEKNGKGITGGFNFLFGRRSAHLELSVNGGVFQDNYRAYSNNPTNALGGVASFYTGFRYQRPAGGFFLKAGLAPSLMFNSRPYENIAFFALPHLELGFTIPNSYQHPKVEEAKAIRKLKKKTKGPYVGQLHLLVMAGAEFSGYYARRSHKPGGQTWGTNTGLNTSTVKPSLIPQLLLEWRVGQHFGMVSGAEFLRKNLEVNWYANEWSYMPEFLAPYTSGNMDLVLNSLRIPVYGKFTFGERLEGACLLGPYFDFKLGHKAAGYGKYGDKNTPEAPFPVRNVNLGNLPLLDDGLVPPGFKIGLGVGLEGRYQLSEQHSILLRTLAGGDFTRQFANPGFGLHWVNVQLGYGLRIK